MEFTAWPKTPRLFRDAVITEKIDGTNAAVIVEQVAPGTFGEDGAVPDNACAVALETNEDGSPSCEYVVGAQSRSRIITPGDDNFAFAAWVRSHAAALVAALGPGTHFGEWWGSGIQRGYGLTNGDKRFSLFNVHRYGAAVEGSEVPGLGVVPVLDQHTFSTERVDWALARMRVQGSSAAPGFMRPEGVVVYHSASRSVFKALIENDNQPKGT